MVTRGRTLTICSCNRLRLTIDEGLIAARCQELANQRASSRYGRQKSALEQEFEQFLGSRATKKTLASALPGDVIEFFIWKDHAGRTKVHKSECQALVSPNMGCNCPKRLAHGTLDSNFVLYLWRRAGLGVACPPWGRKSCGLSLC